MAEKTVKILECDRRGCRRRKGVASVQINMFASTSPEQTFELIGDLCPYHRALLASKITSMFDNTKDQTAR